MTQLTQQEIPSTRWIEFCAQFSRDHADWPVTVEVLDKQTGPQRLADELPLHGLSFDVAGTRPSTLQIAAGNVPTEHLNHRVELPLHIWLVEDDAGASGTIEIEPGRGSPTLVHFHEPESGENPKPS